MSISKLLNSFYKSAFPFKSALLLFLLMATGCDEPDMRGEIDYIMPEQPEMASGYIEKPGWEFTEYGVAAANPLAVDAGYQILSSGGTAVDAAIAVQLVLTLVEPQSSGIGGGAFMLFWDGREVHAYNGRETAPSGADERQFLDENGEPLPYGQAIRSGLSVGVPGTLALLKTAHDNHGFLPWEELFEPAVTLAEQGFKVSPRLNRLLTADEALRKDEQAGSFYYNQDGEAVETGTLLKNPALAAVLNDVAENGIEAFYRSEVARDIARRVQNHERPGRMLASDIQEYLELDLRTEEICTPWKSYSVCGFPPPSSGHLTVMQILGIMEQLEMPETSLQDSIPTAEWLHLFFESSKLAFADRNQYIADPRFVDSPGSSWESMLAPSYLEKRAALISGQSMGEAEPGQPGELQSQYGMMEYQPEYGTSHISIVDAEGNVVSMTTTIESGFGSRIMSDGGTGLEGGFMLNNELTDFSLSPMDEEGNLIANRVEPGKRPRSSMAPTLIFDAETGEFVAATGSPGGTSIIHYTAKSIFGMLDWSLNAQESINLPNFANYNGPSVLEEGRFPDEIVFSLQDMGHEVLTRSMTSGLHIIQKTETGYFGGADPRREGTVMGN